MNLLICDDDPKIVDEISMLLKQRTKFKKTEMNIDKRNSGDFILNESKSYDIAFIDVEMPGISGLKLAEKLKDINPEVLIIIITSFPDYLDNAMKIRVFRYISKPINQNRFYNALYDAAREFYSASKSIIIDMKNEVCSIKTKDILYIETLKHGSLIVTRNGDFKTGQKLSDWLAIINQPECFVYSHSSFVVNLQNVIEFNSAEVKLRKSETEIVTAYMSQRKFYQFKKAFLSFAGGSR